MEEKKKKIYILATGGTIAGRGQQGKTAVYKAGGLNLEELLSTIPKLHDQVEMDGEQMLSVDSNNVTVKDWIQMANRINELSKTDIDGFVITHGTDTMDETAYFLNLTVKTEKPVIITGAMRPATAASADGPLNLYQAISLAASNEAWGQGVLVCFCDSIYSGRDVQKVNTFKTDAFNEKDLACLGYMRDEYCYFYNKSLAVHTVRSMFDVTQVKELPRVDILYFCVDADPDLLRFSAQRAKGIVICGTGSGDYSEAWMKEIAKLEEKRIPVVRASRIGSGVITENKYFEQSQNCIPAYTLPPQKARILLSLALLYTNQFEEIKKIFQRY
ncbi:MAG: asparaginase [Eubacteriales bacterium]|nr:asparaginase [Eubacteriales bacterium]